MGGSNRKRRRHVFLSEYVRPVFRSPATPAESKFVDDDAPGFRDTVCSTICCCALASEMTEE